MVFFKHGWKHSNTVSVFYIFTEALATRKSFSISTNQNSYGKSLEWLSPSHCRYYDGVKVRVDHFLCTIINRVCVFMWWRDNSAVFCEEENPWDPLSIGDWSQTYVGWLEGWERILKCLLCPSLFICKLVLLIHCFKCCLATHYLKTFCWKDAKLILYPPVNGPPASHTFKNSAQYTSVQPVASSCHFLRSCCSLWVQITIWAVQQIFGSSKIWYWWSSSGVISAVFIQNMIKLKTSRTNFFGNDYGIYSSKLKLFFLSDDSNWIMVKNRCYLCVKSILFLRNKRSLNEIRKENK